MHCDDARRQLDALNDGALTADERIALDAHLATCPDCQAAASELTRLDADLRRAFVPRRAAATAIAERVLSTVAGPSVAGLSEAGLAGGERRAGLTEASYRRRPFRTFGVTLAAAAAGFLLAVAIFRPWDKPVSPVPAPGDIAKSPPTPPESPPIQLAVATGAVEVETDGVWKAMPTGGRIAIGCGVRTPATVRCEFHTPDGSEVRLNGGTEIVFRGPRLVQLVRGRVWSSVMPAADAYRVESPVATVTALGTQFDLLHEPFESRLTVLSGRTRVTAGDQDTEVDEGEYLNLGGKRLPDPVRRPHYELLQATNWVNEILQLKGYGNPELVRRIDDLFAQIGQTKTEMLLENDIRLLGDHCVIPLTRYLQSERSRGERQKRQIAARILADLAQPWSIKDLIGLLQDNDAEVRSQAAAALRRLTGQTFGLDPAAWRTASPARSQQARDRWQQWWQENLYRCPTEPPGPRVAGGKAAT